METREKELYEDIWTRPARMTALLPPPLPIPITRP
jgi:hypothetical protein